MSWLDKEMEITRKIFDLENQVFSLWCVGGDKELIKELEAEIGILRKKDPSDYIEETCDWKSIIGITKELLSVNESINENHKKQMKERLLKDKKIIENHLAVITQLIKKPDSIIQYKSDTSDKWINVSSYPL